MHIAGDTMSGSLSISLASGWAGLNINSTAGNRNQLNGYRGANQRWEVDLGDNATESGSNAGSNFTINSYSDAGAFIAQPLVINRASGNATFSGTVAAGATAIPSDMSNTFITGGQIVADSGYTANVYYSSGGSWKYSATGYGSLFLPNNGQWQWFTSPSGTAGSVAPVNATMTLDTGANLTINGATAIKASGTTWANPSSRDIKQNIKPYRPHDGLQAIFALNPVTYRFSEDSGFPTDETHIGLVHDETGHMPEMHRKATIGTSMESEGREVDALDCSPVLFALVRAVQELAAKVEALEKRANGSAAKKR